MISTLLHKSEPSAFTSLVIIVGVVIFVLVSMVLLILLFLYFKLLVWQTGIRVLKVLEENGGWMYGLEISEKIKEKWGKNTRGFICLSLSEMEEAGEIESELVKINNYREPRHKYRITDTGKIALDEARSADQE